MTPSVRVRQAVAVMALLALTACDQVEEAEPVAEGEPPAVVEPADDNSGLSEVTLTQEAVERLALETTPVAQGTSTDETQIPYSAVMYDADGATWAYVEVEPRVYMRESIEVVSIGGDIALLKAGPEVGTPVVSVGAAELYGAEVGVDH